MKLNFSDLLYAFSYGLDCVESQLVPVEAGHGKRVATFSVMLGRRLGLSKEELAELGYIAAMHDNALTEYLYEENQKKIIAPDAGDEDMLWKHCEEGENNIRCIPISQKLKNSILYHHEEADGSGPFGKKGNEIPLCAGLIHMADVLDAEFYLGSIDNNKFHRICEYVKENINIRFLEVCANAFLAYMDISALSELSDLEVHKELPESGEYDYSEEQVRKFCDLWIKIIDYKSEFTSRHSFGVSSLAEKMGHYYGFDDEKCMGLYFAGAVHDIGKLTTDSKILEKAGRLTESEFEIIKDHAYQSWNILKDVRGLEEITRWAVHHHEKLNGQGYPFGKSEEELCFEERLMACVDIYQALTEDRPYKEGLSHEDAIKIMRDMVTNHFIDGDITEDMAVYFTGK